MPETPTRSRSLTQLRQERRQLALDNERQPSEATAARILALDWKIAGIPPEPLTGGALADAMEADRMAIRDGFDPRWPA